MRYRKEIDGLRAVAVLPVILFHAGFKEFSGGFVGVDVFFVISGYLITSLLLAEMGNGSFSLINFYERRARRILPALFVVMLCCLPFAWMWLLPQDLKRFSVSLIGVSGYFSNIMFWIQSGYFERAVELKPLIHTWSLSVEEQYYLLFPVFLLLVWRLGRRSIFWILVAIAILSLCLAQIYSIKDPTKNFYVLQTRGWELLIGCLVAFYQAKIAGAEIKYIKLRQVLSVVGVLFISYAVFMYDKYTPYPSVYTLLPTVGAALIILCATQQTLVGRFLSNKLFVGVGLISYSLYLWHQPIFAFARVRSPQHPDKLMYGVLIVLSILMAYLSWKYVEAPFRNKNRINRKSIFIISLSFTAFFVSIGAVGYYYKGFKSRIPDELLTIIEPEKVNLRSCINRKNITEDESATKVCEFGSLDSDKTLLLYGDSHAEALLSAMDSRLKERHIKGILVQSHCHPIPNVFSTNHGNAKDPAACQNSADNILKLLKEVNYVVIAIRWTSNLYPVQDYITAYDYDNTEGGQEYPNPPMISYTLKYGGYSTDSFGKEQAINEFLDNFTNSGKQVFLIYPIPEAGWDIPNYNYINFLSGKPVQAVISTSYDAYKARHKYVKSVLDGFGERSNLQRIRPEEIFCNTFVQNRCVVQLNSTPLYYDDDHLSNKGAGFLIDEIMKQLKQD
jgi:peptidoglycan/LPS O-acetylase OafA/YrhL